MKLVLQRKSDGSVELQFNAECEQEEQDLATATKLATANGTFSVDSLVEQLGKLGY